MQIKNNQQIKKKLFKEMDASWPLPNLYIRNYREEKRK